MYDILVNTGLKSGAILTKDVNKRSPVPQTGFLPLRSWANFLKKANAKQQWSIHKNKN